MSVVSSKIVMRFYRVYRHFKHCYKFISKSYSDGLFDRFIYSACRNYNFGSYLVAEKNAKNNIKVSREEETHVRRSVQENEFAV